MSEISQQAVQPIESSPVAEVPVPSPAVAKDAKTRSLPALGGWRNMMPSMLRRSKNQQQEPSAGAESHPSPSAPPAAEATSPLAPSAAPTGATAPAADGALTASEPPAVAPTRNGGIPTGEPLQRSMTVHEQSSSRSGRPAAQRSATFSGSGLSLNRLGRSHTIHASDSALLSRASTMRSLPADPPVPRKQLVRDADGVWRAYTLDELKTRTAAAAAEATPAKRGGMAKLLPF